MAEKYGEVPPKFTKKWWEYFWDYYKWHVIITVVAVLIASVTIVQCATRPKYDMNVVYAGHMNYSEEEINKLKEIISERISDIDGNGENSVLLSTLVFADNAGSRIRLFLPNNKACPNVYGRLFIYLSYGQS